MLRHPQDILGHPQDISTSPTGYIHRIYYVTHRIYHVFHRIYPRDYICYPQDISTGLIQVVHRICPLWVPHRIYFLSCGWVLWMIFYILWVILIYPVDNNHVTHRIYLSCCPQDMHPQDLFFWHPQDIPYCYPQDIFGHPQDDESLLWVIHRILSISCGWPNISPRGVKWMHILWMTGSSLRTPVGNTLLSCG